MKQSVVSSKVEEVENGPCQPFPYVPHQKIKEPQRSNIKIVLGSGFSYGELNIKKNFPKSHL